MMVLNRRNRIYQNMEQLSHLEHIPYQMPWSKAPCLHIPLKAQECDIVEVNLNTKYTKTEDETTKHQKYQINRRQALN